MVSNGGGDVEMRFAKLQDEDFKYHMQTYSILLNRSSKKSTMDVDLANLCGGMKFPASTLVSSTIFPTATLPWRSLERTNYNINKVLHISNNPPI